MSRRHPSNSTARPFARVVAVVTAVAIGLGIAWFARARAFEHDRVWVGGIQVNEADHATWFDALRDAGLNTVSATVYAKQGDWDTDHLWWEDEEPHVLREIRGARERGLRVVLIPRVALDHAFPRNAFLWHGMILPRTPDAIDRWFDRYAEFVLRWAAVAEGERVDVFAVGSEMSVLTSTVPVEEVPDLERWFLDDAAQASWRDRLLRFEDVVDPSTLGHPGGEPFADLRALLEARIEANRTWARLAAAVGAPEPVAVINARAAHLERRWRELIAEVRAVYGGRLTYAANFDQYRRVGFWDALDLVGINAYFSLRGGSGPAPRGAALDRALLDGWRQVFDELQAFRETSGIDGKRTLFTEIGYTFREDSTVQPWAGTGFWLDETGEEPRVIVWGARPREPLERAAALRALRRAAEERGGDNPLAGLLYWKLSTVPEHREIEPFVAILGETEEDPAIAELRRFGVGVRSSPVRRGR